MAQETMDVRHLIEEYRPGSVLDPDWRWPHEMQFLMRRDQLYVALLTEDIKRNGMHTPILLGDDGRVWDGHHRIAAAMLSFAWEVPVEYGFGGNVEEDSV